MSEYLKKLTTPDGKVIKVYTPDLTELVNLQQVRDLGDIIAIGQIVTTFTNGITNEGLNHIKPLKVPDYHYYSNLQSYVPNVDYTNFNRVHSQSYASPPTEDWELTVYFTTPEQLYYNLSDIFAKPVPTFVLRGSATGRLVATFYDPDFALEDYGDYGVTEDEINFGRYELHPEGSTSAGFFNTSANSALNSVLDVTRENGFLLWSEDIELSSVRYTDYLRFWRDEIPQQYWMRWTKQKLAGGIADNFVEVKPMTELSRAVDANATAIEEMQTQVDANATAISSVKASVNGVQSLVDTNASAIDAHLDYLIQMAQYDGRLMFETSVNKGTVIRLEGDNSNISVSRNSRYLSSVVRYSWWFGDATTFYTGVKKIYSMPMPARSSFYGVDDVGIIEATALFSYHKDLEYVHPDLFRCVKDVYQIDLTRGFYNCTKLETLQIDLSAVRIADSAFHGLTNLKTFYCPCHLNNLISANFMFYNSGSSATPIPTISLTAPNIISADSMFGNTKVEQIKLFSFSANKTIVSMDAWAKGSSVKTITQYYSDFSTVENIDDAFLCCWNLSDINAGFLDGLKISVSFADCSRLTRESILNVINAVADLSAEGATATLTLHATAKARLTDDDIAIATAKGWTIA